MGDIEHGKRLPGKNWKQMETVGRQVCEDGNPQYLEAFTMGQNTGTGYVNDGRRLKVRLV